MSFDRIALIFNGNRRPDTTGFYCKRALEQLARIEHIDPSQLDTIPPDRFDLYLNIDEGMRYRLPRHLRPCVWWAIDTHVDFGWYQEKGRDFDLVFAAQLDGATRLRNEEVADAIWLPLACDPYVHRRYPLEKEFDISFVGNNCPGARENLLKAIQQRYRKSFVGHRYFEEMAKVYSASRIIFNRSVKNDVNMRVFEAPSCGSLLMTNDLSENGLDQLFKDGLHLATYRSEEELFDKIAFYLKNEATRERIAEAGRREAVERHTYRHRMELLLRVSEERLGNSAVRPRVSLPDGGPAVDKGPLYFGNARPELLAMIPNNARSVLDIGCGAGRLGEALKARQEVTVTGIELNEAAARAASGRIDRVIIGDIESLEFPFEGCQFDCVVCGDVLEHLRDPGQVLRKVRNWLSAGGRVIASIPNVRNLSVVASLLAGNWTYEPAGLLDSTHLRFFTRRNIQAMFDEAGYRIEALSPVPGPGHDEWEQTGRPGSVNLASVRLMGMPADEAEEFFIYQYLVNAVRRPETIDVLDQKAPAGISGAKSLAETRPDVLGGLGCVIAVQNRPKEYLQRTLQTYHQQRISPADQLLLDYASDRDYANAYRQLCEEYGWRYARIDPPEARWKLSAAYNHAVSLLRPGIEVVFKNDADVLLGPGVLAEAARWGRKRLCIFPLRSTSPDTFSIPEDVAGWVASQKILGHMHSEGVHAYPIEWFREIGGFDLEFEGWGFEDSDLRLRAQWSIGLIRVTDVLLVHQWHPQDIDDQRVAENSEMYERMKLDRIVVRNGGRLTMRKEKSGQDST